MNALIKKRLDTLKEKVGFAAAVFIMRDELPAQFWDSLGLEEWLNIYKYPVEDDIFNGRAFNAIIKLASDFNQWVVIFNNAPVPSQLHTEAAKNLLTINLVFSDWHDIFKNSEKDPELHQRALAEMHQLAKQFDECLIVFQLAPPRSRIKQEVLADLKIANYTYTDWQQLSSRTSHTEIKNLAATKMSETASTLEELIEVYDKAEGDNQLRSDLLNRISTLELPYDDWNQIDKDIDDDELKKVIRAKLIATIKDTNDIVSLFNASTDKKTQAELLNKLQAVELSLSAWLDVYKEITNNSQTNPIIIPKMLELIADFDDLSSFFEVIDEDDIEDEQMPAVVEKINCFQADFSQWKDLYENADHDVDSGRAIFQKMMETADDLDDLLELYDDLPARSKDRQIIAEKISQLDMTYEDVKDKYEDQNESSDEAVLLLHKMVGLTTDLDELVYIWGQATSDNSDIEKLVIDKIRASDAGFESLKSAYDDHDDEDSDLSKALLEKMAGCAETLDELIELCTLAADKSKHQRAALAKLKELSVDYKKLSSAYDDLEDDDKQDTIGKALLQLMLAKTEKLTDLVWIYNQLEEQNHDTDAATARLGVINATFKDWQAIVEDTDNDSEELRELAAEKMLGLAQGYMDFCLTFINADNGSQIRKKAKTKLLSLDLTTKQWQTVRDKANEFDCDDLVELADKYLGGD